MMILGLDFLSFFLAIWVGNNFCKLVLTLIQSRVGNPMYAFFSTIILPWAKLNNSVYIIQMNSCCTPLNCTTAWSHNRDGFSFVIVWA
jgi:hypothetical protein